MDFSLSPGQQQIRDEVRKLCLQFDDAYWLEKDRSGEFPHELHAALAAAGWLGIAMPEEYGGGWVRLHQSGDNEEDPCRTRGGQDRGVGGGHQNIRRPT